MPRTASPVVIGAALVAALPVGIAVADNPVRPSVHEVATAWSVDASVVLPLLAAVWLYDLGCRALWRRFGRWRVIHRQSVAAFATAIALLVLALVSPLDALAASLFSAHMAQHMLLVLAIPPLLLISRADLAIAAALPGAWQRGVRRWFHRPAQRRCTSLLLHPATAWGFFAAIFWLWHVPMFYDAALHHDSIHAAEHVALLIAGLLFWRVVLRAAGQRAFPYALAIGFVFTSMLQMSVLAAMLTFSSVPWYPAYGAPTAQWGISLLTDQRTGALVMWMTSNGVFLGLIVLLFARWFAVEERRADHPVHVTRA